MIQQEDSVGMAAAAAASAPAPPGAQTKPAPPPPVACSPAHAQSPVSSAAPPPVPPLTAGCPKIDGRLNQYGEIDGRGVVVKNLPVRITAEKLEEELRSRFGPVKAGGVIIKGPKDMETALQQPGSTCYVFVEFQDEAAAMAASGAGRIQIMGKEVRIEEKKAFGRGRGRGGPVRGDRAKKGMMPRGYLSGGRGR